MARPTIQVGSTGEAVKVAQRALIDRGYFVGPPGAPAVLFGVGISIGVQFGQGTAPQRSMDFISAGCDFRP